MEDINKNLPSLEDSRLEMRIEMLRQITKSTADISSKTFSSKDLRKIDDMLTLANEIGGSPSQKATSQISQ